MKLTTRFSSHPDDAQYYTTEELRKQYLIEQVFVPDDINLIYSHDDRIIAGGAMPVTTDIALPSTKELGTSYFLERREMGIINVGGEGWVLLDGKEYKMSYQDGLYVGCGTREIIYRSLDAKHPAQFYINSCPAHHAYPSVHIPLSKARHVAAGTASNLNRRIINQYIHPEVCQSCQLVMGMTILDAGSVWNTMPAHTHERRMEVYFYFNLGPDDIVFHVMGKPDETRHLIVRNEQAVISPSWSVHSGVATSSYSFIWGMCGENQTFTDMDAIDMKKLL